MKRMSLLVLVVLSIVIISVTAYAAKQDNIIIGWSNAGMGDSWRQFLNSNFLAEVDKHPEISQFYITNADENPMKQVNDISDLITKGVDGLIIYPTLGEALAPIIESAYAEGIPVVIFGGKVPTEDYTCLVTQDLKEFGRAQAQWLVDQLEGKGKIIMLSGISGNTTAEERLAGAREVFEKYPEIEILDHQYCDWSATKTKNIMEAMMMAFPEIDGIWSDSGLMSLPALQALKEVGRPLVPSTGDQLNGYAKFLVENNIPGFVYPMTTKLSAESVKILLEAIKGQEVGKVHYIDIQGMGPEAIKEFVRPEASDWWWIGDDQIPEKFLPNIQ